MEMLENISLCSHSNVGPYRNYHCNGYYWMLDKTIQKLTGTRAPSKGFKIA
jgi:hypothetical protein